MPILGLGGAVGAALPKSQLPMGHERLTVQVVDGPAALTWPAWPSPTDFLLLALSCSLVPGSSVRSGRHLERTQSYQTATPEPRG